MRAKLPTAMFRHDRRGATAIEYGLIVALIALSALGAISLFADTSVGIWNDVATKFANAAPS